MRTLVTACLLIGAYFLGAYVDRVTAAPGWGVPDALAGYMPSALAGNPPDPMPGYASVPMPPSLEAMRTAPLAGVPIDARLQPRPGMSARAEKDCLPTLLRRGMSYTESSHVCGLIVSGLARNDRP
jgi:hypothetical protein